MPIIQSETLKFLAGLARNNNKEWFEKNRPRYEAAKANFIEFNRGFVQQLKKFDPELGDIDPTKTIFRINRDIRFSKDKSPYKTNFGTSISRGGKKIMAAGYYFHLQPGNQSFGGGGIWQPEPDKLQSIRQEIDYHLDEFKKILGSASFKKIFSGLDDYEKLKTVPKGYSPDNPGIEFIKNKNFIVTRNFSDKEVTSPGFLKDISQCMKAVFPLNKFLNRAIS